MPTGYTAAVADGITFQQFAMNCAREFGACISMEEDPADAPIPAEFNPSDYHTKALDVAHKRLAVLKGMSLEDAEHRARLSHDTAVIAQLTRQHDRQALLDKYARMLSAVEAWAPPTPDHQGMKDFMLSQLKQAIEWDCSPMDGPPPRLLSGADWLAEQFTQANSDIAYHQKGHAEEVERAATRTAWVKALRESLRAA